MDHQDRSDVVASLLAINTVLLALVQRQPPELWDEVGDQIQEVTKRCQAMMARPTAQPLRGLLDLGGKS